MKILIDTHTHSVHSGHAYSTVDENMKFASEKGMTTVCITDHAFAMPGGAHSFYFFNLKIVPSVHYGVNLLKGVELNILDTDGNIDDFKNEVSMSVYDALEFRIASLHPPCIPENANFDYTKTIINTMKKNNIDCLGHLGDPRYPFNIDEVVKFAKENNTLIELNNSSLNQKSLRFDKDFTLRIIDACFKYDAKMTFGSDAHYFTDVGNFDNIHALFAEEKIPYDNIITTNEQEFLNFLKENRG